MTQEINRKHKAEKHLQATHNRTIKYVDKEIESVNTRLSKEVTDVTEWESTYNLLLTVPGIGDGVAYTLLGELPELGKLTNRQSRRTYRISTLQPRQWLNER